MEKCVGDNGKNNIGNVKVLVRFDLSWPLARGMSEIFKITINLSSI